MHCDTSTVEALKKLEAQLSSDLEAVRRTLSLAQQTQTPVQEALADLVSIVQGSATATESLDLSPQKLVERTRKVSDLVRQAVTEFSGSFGIGEVKTWIRMHSDRTFGDVAIRQQLKKMEQEGELVATFQGLGRTGNQYAKTSRFQPSSLF